MKKLFLVFAIAFIASGCATGRNNIQSDLDALNAKVTGLQGQLESKNREIANLQDQQRAIAAQADAANRAKADAEARLMQALDKLSAKSASSVDSSSVKKSSYIK